MKRIIALWILLVAAIIGIALTQQQKVVKVSRQQAIQTVEQQIGALNTRINELNGMRTAWLLTEVDSVYVPESWTR